MRAVVTLKLKPILRERAEANLVEAGKATGRGKVRPNLAEPFESANVRDELAKLSGLSNGTISKGQVVLDRGDEATKAAMLLPKDGRSIVQNGCFSMTRCLSLSADDTATIRARHRRWDRFSTVGDERLDS
jgi:hypothetical protein